MQPIAIFTGSQPGLLHVNGRLAGEIAPEAPFFTPVTPQGNLYVEFFPYARGRLPVAARIAFQNSAPDSPGAGLRCVHWPGNCCEIQLFSPPAFSPEGVYGMLDGTPVAVLPGETPLLRVAGNLLALPAGGKLPHLHLAGAGFHLYLGSADAGEYLACFDENYQPVDVLAAGSVRLEEGSVRALTDLEDTVGHLRETLWQPTPEGFSLVRTDYHWANAGPAWPQTPEDTALALLEAALLGLTDEARGYAAPGLTLPREGDGEAAMSLRYGAPQGRNAVGLLRAVSETLARVQPIYYRAEPQGGAQGPYRITALE